MLCICAKLKTHASVSSIDAPCIMYDHKHQIIRRLYCRHTKLTPALCKICTLLSMLCLLCAFCACAVWVHVDCDDDNDGYVFCADLPSILANKSPHSNSKHIGTANITMLAPSGGVMMAATKKQATII